MPDRTRHNFRPESSLARPLGLSADFQIRLNASQLALLEWDHLDTDYHDANEIPCGRCCATEGFTEWCVSFQGRTLTLGWDWTLCDDGQVIANPAVPPRTNLQCLDQAGYDRSHEAHIDALWRVISAIPWARVVSVWVHDLAPYTKTSG